MPKFFVSPLARLVNTSGGMLEIYFNCLVKLIYIQFGGKMWQPNIIKCRARSSGGQLRPDRQVGRLCVPIAQPVLTFPHSPPTNTKSLCIDSRSNLATWETRNVGEANNYEQRSLDASPRAPPSSLPLLQAKRVGFVNERGILFTHGPLPAGPGVTPPLPPSEREHSPCLTRRGVWSGE